MEDEDPLAALVAEFVLEQRAAGAADLPVPSLAELEARPKVSAEFVLELGVTPAPATPARPTNMTSTAAAATAFAAPPRPQIPGLVREIDRRLAPYLDDFFKAEVTAHPPTHPSIYDTASATSSSTPPPP